MSYALRGSDLMMVFVLGIGPLEPLNRSCSTNTQDKKDFCITKIIPKSPYIISQRNEILVMS